MPDDQKPGFKLPDMSWLSSTVNKISDVVGNPTGGAAAIPTQAETDALPLNPLETTARQGLASVEEIKKGAGEIGSAFTGGGSALERVVRGGQGIFDTARGALGFISAPIGGPIEAAGNAVQKATGGFIPSGTIQAATALGRPSAGTAAEALMPARKLPEGGVDMGKPGEAHNDILAREGAAKRPEKDLGFAKPDGTFVDREKAAAMVGKPGDVLTSEKLADMRGEPHGSPTLSEAKDNLGGDLGAARAPPATPPGRGTVRHQDVIDIEDRLKQDQQDAENLKLEYEKAFRQYPESARQPGSEARMYKYGEENRAHGASPEEAATFDTHLKPMREQMKRELEDLRYIMDPKEYHEFIDAGGFEKVKGGYMPRILVDDANALSKAAGKTSMGESFGGARNFGKRGRTTAAAEKEREYFALQDESGKRTLVEKRPDGSVVDVKTNKPVGQADKLDLYHAHADEIAEYTNDPFHQNATATLSEAHYQVRRAKNQALTTQAQKADFQHRGWATTDKRMAKKLGWKEPRFPGWANTYVHPRVAAALDKKVPTGNVHELLDWLSDATRKIQNNLFVNPFTHGRNILANFVSDRGWANVDPRVWAKMPEAWNDAKNHTKFAEEAYAKGAPLWTPQAKIQKYMEDVFKADATQVENDKSFISLAKRLGVKPLELFESYKRHSHVMTGHINDMFVLARIKEKMAGPSKMSMEQAIKETTMAKYDIPSEAVIPGGVGRKISEAIAGKHSNILFSFARWHYSVAKMLVNPAVNAVKGAMAVGKSGAEAKMARRQAVDAVGQIVAQAVAYNVIAGVGDKLTQDLTGDKNARMAAWGPFAYIRLIDDLAHGRLNTPYDWAKAATAGLLAPSPFAGILLAAFQKNFNFTDMHVKKGQSMLEKQMGTIAKDVFPPEGMLKDAFDNPLKEGLNQLTGVSKTPNAQKYKR